MITKSDNEDTEPVCGWDERDTQRGRCTLENACSHVPLTNPLPLPYPTALRVHHCDQSSAAAVGDHNSPEEQGSGKIKRHGTQARDKQGKTVGGTGPKTGGGGGGRMSQHVGSSPAVDFQHGHRSAHTTHGEAFQRHIVTTRKAHRTWTRCM